MRLIPGSDPPLPPLRRPGGMRRRTFREKATEAARGFVSDVLDGLGNVTPAPPELPRAAPPFVPAVGTSPPAADAPQASRGSSRLSTYRRPVGRQPLLIAGANPRSTARVRNEGPGRLWIGDENVAVNVGMNVPAGEERRADVTQSLYGVSDRTAWAAVVTEEGA